MKELEITERLSKDKQAGIAGIKQGASGIEVKLNDKVKALELIGRHLGMFTVRVEHTSSIDILDKVKANRGLLKV